MTKVRETYRPVLMAADASEVIGGARLGGFLAATAGTLTVTDFDGTVHVNAHPVTEGQDVPLPLYFNSLQGGTVTLAGGASGTLFV